MTSHTRPAAGGRLVATVAGLALAAAACGGGATAAPSTTPATSSPGGATPATSESTPSSAPTVGASAMTGSEAFPAASAALDALDSYAFRVEIRSTSVSGSTTTSSHTVLSGVVENKPDTASTLLNQDLDASGTPTSSTGIVIIGQQAWIQDGVNGPWQSVPVAQADIFVQSMAGFRPEKMFSLYFAALAGSFTAVGTETKNGVAATHYTGDQSIGAILGTLTGTQGSWSSDVWIANDGGYLVHSEANGQGSTAGSGGSYGISVDITKPNGAGPVTAPAS